MVSEVVSDIDIDIHTLFTENGWNFLNHNYGYTYTKFGHETDPFCVRNEGNVIHVIVPIKNSEFQYRTSFRDSLKASEYLKMRFLSFINN